MEGGDLEAEGFAAASGEQGKDIAAGEGCLDNIALKRPELGITEGGVERVEQVGHGKVGAKFNVRCSTFNLEPRGSDRDLRESGARYKNAASL